MHSLVQLEGSFAKLLSHPTLFLISVFKTQKEILLQIDVLQPVMQVN
jgi:hypothetical protein